MSEVYVCPNCGSGDELRAEVRSWETVKIGTEFADAPDLGVLEGMGDRDLAEPVMLHGFGCECGWGGEDLGVLTLEEAAACLVLREED